MSGPVLVTGGDGFIGRNALEALVGAGIETHALHVTPEPRVVIPGVHWHRCDLLASASDAVKVVQAKALLHLAWVSEHGTFWESAENLRWVGASLELIRAFRDRGGERVVVAGTCAEYRWGSPEPLHETRSDLAPSTLYGACKDALRRTLEAYARSSGLSFGWGRVFFLYGPHEDPRRFVAHVARTLLRGETAKCTHGKQVRDFMHVRDVAGGLVALLRADVQGAVNIATGRGVSLADVARTLEELTGGTVDLGGLPARPGDPESIVADAARLQQEIGFRPSLSLRDGLADVVASARAD